jgi:deoxyadenosine/deoxycytidine kinase
MILSSRWNTLVFEFADLFLEQSFRPGNANSVKIIQDRTIYEDALIFAPNLYSMGLMTNRDFQNYSSLFD